MQWFLDKHRTRFETDRGAYAWNLAKLGFNTAVHADARRGRAILGRALRMSPGQLAIWRRWAMTFAGSRALRAAYARRLNRDVGQPTTSSGA